MREIPLRNADGETAGRALVDEADFFTLNTLCWHLSGGYAVHMFARWPARK